MSVVYAASSPPPGCAGQRNAVNYACPAFHHAIEDALTTKPAGEGSARDLVSTVRKLSGVIASRQVVQSNGAARVGARAG
jgi:hypothetical protein